MTERKPIGMSFDGWVERQIQDARKRGTFDDLPHRGQPLPGIDGCYDENGWAREYLCREGLSFLPPALQLKVDVERTLEKIERAPSAAEVRTAMVLRGWIIVLWDGSSFSSRPARCERWRRLARITAGMPVVRRLLLLTLSLAVASCGEGASATDGGPPPLPYTGSRVFWYSTGDAYNLELDFDARTFRWHHDGCDVSGGDTGRLTTDGEIILLVPAPGLTRFRWFRGPDQAEVRAEFDGSDFGAVSTTLRWADGGERSHVWIAGGVCPICEPDHLAPTSTESCPGPFR